MQLTILKIILWPKDTAFRPRVIPFEPGKINVISGESGDAANRRSRGSSTIASGAISVQYPSASFATWRAGSACT